MRAFSQLLDDLTYTRSRNAKLRRIGDYLKSTPDPDRGYALGALTGTLDIPHVKPAAIRAMAEEKIDPVLYKMSRDYVGDSAETIALLWDQDRDYDDAPANDIRLKDAVETLQSAKKTDAPLLLAAMLDRLDPSGRYALIKIATGALRVGISARLAKVALAEAWERDVEKVEEVWHAFEPPFETLFAWAEGRADLPDLSSLPLFRPFMLAHPLEDEERIDLTDYAAEWKWDGIRVQLVRAGGETRLYSRTGDDIGQSFPDVCEAFDMAGVVDGELLVRGDHQGGEAGSFNALQQRLGRKTVSKKMLAEAPAFVRLYDVLIEGSDDVRPMAWQVRRERLEQLMPRLDTDRFDLSQLVEADTFDQLEALREEARDTGVEGLMLKRKDSPYVPGRKVGLWYKWKRDPLNADCVLMYAQRGSGKRSSIYSDYTFGCWAEDGSLLPVGKAYFGFTDEELKWLDRFVRRNTLNRFGPVREVEKSLVLEVAFDSIHLSKRHKSGLAMRFPRISRIRKDKPAHEADRIETLQAMVTG
ncbi:cisplatin damage response ATP-dependent DNA ligase [Sphingomicrobium sediminis]|uniref:DNA ligase (ATP) n=1 Tax=Sphingomicrobium sediminis TaxID=2950949 RepID=A0A9X2J5D9_9SPHN|nr:cisplatin damage response ATP-dependent DNA ligase [Sphingomicrobium sediminis]MCM8558162.1 cisplatin damage response ATP-dependent DNA ligase [Sphingomicrobium sediminis]